MLTPGVEIEIYSDVVCPWCYIGKRRLEDALEGFPVEVTLRWRAYPARPEHAAHVRAVDRLAGLALRRRRPGPAMVGHASAAAAGRASTSTSTRR